MKRLSIIFLLLPAILLKAKTLNLKKSGACVYEIHLVEAMHLNNPAPEKLKVTTIACYDKIDLVKDFMTKKKYGYQVLMSDGKVEHDFKVSSFPTKVLLLPNGVYLNIPLGSEYSTLVSKYLAWEL
jgi:hypothetical protein